MAFQITIDAQAALDRVNDMLHKIDHFKRVDIGAGLSQFQTEDMHRHRPFTMRSRAKGLATTVVRPHSLYEMERSGRIQRRYAKARTRYLGYIAAGKQRRRKPKYVSLAESYRHWSTRPVLRQEMYDVLNQRMTRLFIDKIHWKK